MPAKITNGRDPKNRTKTNTVVPKSATQAILMKQDEIIVRINALKNALATAADVAAINAAAAALADIQPVALIR